MTMSSIGNSGLEKARAEVYRFFATLFLNQPTQEILDGVLSDQGASALEALFPDDPSVGRFRELVEDYRNGNNKAEEFLLDYESMFRVPGEAYIHPYESVYRHESYPEEGVKKAMVYGVWAQEVAKLYEAEGLAPIEGFTELPDHLGVELEFMAFLCHRAAEAVASGDNKDAEIFGSKQREFLQKHLLSWSEKCLMKMKEKASTPLYLYLANLLKSFLAEEGSC
jgi:TorA maturation chaperone TorD